MTVYALTTKLHVSEWIDGKSGKQDTGEQK